MARNISATALANLMQPTGLEPVNILRIQWVKDGGYYFYADRNIQENPDIKGTLLSIDGLESVLNIDKNISTTSVKIVLDDIDSSVKNIFNYNDINNRPVVIYQAFIEKLDFP